MIKRIHSTLFRVKNLAQTANFYQHLGFDVKKDLDALRIIFGDYRFAFIDDQKDTDEIITSPKGLGIMIYFEVENMDNFYTTLKENGIKTKDKPVDQPWGKKELTIYDPDGYRLVFFENL